MKTRTLQTLSFWIALLLFTTACTNKAQHHKPIETITLDELKERGELVVLTLSGSTSYFIYRGHEMGFQYELSRQFEIGRAHV